LSRIKGMTGPPEGVPFRGYVQVYTGNGKGKTTAALGLAFRAAGHGMRTYIGQFLKGQHYGELTAAARLSPFIRIERFGREGFLHVTEGPDDEDLRRAGEGLRKCRAAMLSGKFRIVVLDEVLTAVLLKVLTEKDVLDFLAAKPDGVELVLTGRGAPQAVIDRADLVTEMKDVKHYFEKGVKARIGIEK
jgi:cob(I)alamin adenosyltransferase